MSAVNEGNQMKKISGQFATTALASFVWLCSSLVLQADVRVSTDNLELTFSDRGTLELAVACYRACHHHADIVQQFNHQNLVGFELPASGWTVDRQSADSETVLTFANASGQSLTWQIPNKGFRVGLRTQGVNEMTLSSGESFRPREASGFGTWLEQSRYVVFNQGDVEQIGFEETDVVKAEADRWVGYRNRFWAALIDAGSFAIDKRTVELSTSEIAYDAKLQLALGEKTETSLYLGPIEPQVLKRADPELTNLLYAGLWFWLRWICFGLFYLLGFIQMAIPSIGLSIMAMSLVVGTLMTPLTRIADRLQQEVHEIEARLAPEMARIKKQHKGEAQSAAILELYKKENVHPLYSLKSLMGVAVVIPVFIGAFDMLAENIQLLHAGFLWISDLSLPDALFSMPFSLPFFGDKVNLLPFLMTGLSVIASHLHNPPVMDEALRKKQRRNMVLMAIGFFVLFYTFPAGMVLYWTTNNLISVVKSLWARR